MLLTPSAAFACKPVKGADRKQHCRSSFRQPCPTATGQSTTAYDIENVTRGALKIAYRLGFSPAGCPNATLTKHFDPNAKTKNPDGTTPNPPPGKQAVRVVWTWTGQGASAGGNPTAMVDVSYDDPCPGSPGKPTPCPVVPDALFTDLVHIDRKLARLIHDEREGLPFGQTTSRVHQIHRAKLRMVDQFFGQEVYGVKFSEVFDKLDCLDVLLENGRLQDNPLIDHPDHAVAAFEEGKKCKQKLEAELHKAGGRARAGPLRAHRLSLSSRVDAFLVATLRRGVS